MREQSGRSLIELIGFMAIVSVMTVSSVKIYNTVRKNQIRTIANAELNQLVENTKLLMENYGSYEGLSIDYLIKAGALKNNQAPIGDDGWSIVPSVDGKSFSINLVNLSSGDCNYFSATLPKWANNMLVNGFETTSTNNCFDSSTNQVSFIVE